MTGTGDGGMNAVAPRAGTACVGRRRGLRGTATSLWTAIGNRPATPQSNPGSHARTFRRMEAILAADPAAAIGGAGILTTPDSFDVQSRAVAPAGGTCNVTNLRWRQFT